MSNRRTDLSLSLKEMTPQAEFFIGIDSDGCVFDSMEIKHKKCFAPNFIQYFGLEPVAQDAREVWEFVNLYSTTRGCNRFLAVMRALQLLREKVERHKKHVNIPLMEGLQAWINRETTLGNPTLERELASNPDVDLQLAYEFSLDVNRTIEKIAVNIPPYPLVRESLEKMVGKADIIVVSQTPVDTIKKEWREQDLVKFVRLIAGQEMGTKTEHIAFAALGKYPHENILMIGDAPGDLQAAQDNNVLFYPINPGHEEASWKRFHHEALDRFFSGTYAGAYEKDVINEFKTYLPEKPPWET